MPTGASSPPARGAIVACVMLATAMVALETTVVATAMPRIIADVGGMRFYSWAFSSFALTQTATTVVFGKIADARGRRPVTLIGIVLFVVGSVLAGAAGTMPVMIGGRLFQGVGAGAILPVMLTIIADLYPARERGRVQGWVASVWAVSAVFGPMLGAAIIAWFSWRWIFWCNVPLGLVTSLGFIQLLPPDEARARVPVDYAGAGLFTLAVGFLLGLLTDPATAGASRLVLCAGGFVGLSALFAAQERRAADPIVSVALWRRAPIAAANGAALITGMALMGITTFLPMYVQSVLGRTPVVAGLTLTTVMVGWPMGATLGARLFPHIGLRPTLLAGGALVPTGASLFALLAPDSSPVLAAAGSLVMGFGMGLVSITSLILVQELAGEASRGAATAANLFARNLGSALGAAVLGAVQAVAVAHSVHLTDALSRSLHVTFVALFVIACCSLVCVLLIPAEVLRSIWKGDARTA